MSCPPIWKWKPSVHWYRSKQGWQFAVYQHNGYNPVFELRRWNGCWYCAFYADCFWSLGMWCRYTAKPALRRIFFKMHSIGSNKDCRWCHARALYVAAAHERGGMPAIKHFLWLVAAGAAVVYIMHLAQGALLPP